MYRQNLDKMLNPPNDTRKFEKKMKEKNWKNKGILSFTSNQVKQVENILKKPVAHKSLSEETRTPLKPVETRLDVMYWLFKVHKDIGNNFSPFWVCPQSIFLPISKQTF